MSKEKKPMGLYIHIPFCNRKCDYCDFVSYSMDKKAQELYFEALCAEIDMLKLKYVDQIFDSLYIGGGTPSIVYEGFIRSLSRKLFSSFHFTDDAEFTLEVNPSSFNKTKFFEYVESGVNRISIGVQCLDSRLLKKQGRIQSVKNIKKTFKILNNAEFPNVSADVMIGLPGQKVGSVKKTVEYLIYNCVRHISVYSLQVEKNTLLYEKSRRRKHKPFHKDKTLLKMYNTATDILESYGYHRYEVSNFARYGFESRHNKKYWDNTNYLGLGVSAHSYIDGYRYFNTKRLDTYIDAMKEGKSAIYSKEYIDKETARTERIMLALRTEDGLNLEEFKKEFNEDLLKSRAEQIKLLQEKDMIVIKDGYLKIREEHFYVSNSIIIELI